MVSPPFECEYNTHTNSSNSHLILFLSIFLMHNYQIFFLYPLSLFLPPHDVIPFGSCDETPHLLLSLHNYYHITSINFLSCYLSRRVYIERGCLPKIFHKQNNLTISFVMSSSVAPNGATVLWIRNLSLHCISGGAMRWACIVTASNTHIIKYRNHTSICVHVKNCTDNNGKIPVKSHFSLGLMMPMLGLTQYFFGDVVLTCEQRLVNYRYAFCYSCADIGIWSMWLCLLLDTNTNVLALSRDTGKIWHW